MNKTWIKLLVLGLALLLLIAPFAGLAPLMLVLLIAVAITFISTLWQSLTASDNQREG